MKIPGGIDGRNLASPLSLSPLLPQETLQQREEGEIEIGQRRRPALAAGHHIGRVPQTI